MAKLRRYEPGKYDIGRGFEHYCPGCGYMHRVAVEEKNASGAAWSFDGNMDAPTFSPSVNNRVGPMPTAPEGRPDAGQMRICHYFLRAGVIEFLGDCTHKLRGQCVPLPDIPEKL